MRSSRISGSRRATALLGARTVILALGTYLAVTASAAEPSPTTPQPVSLTKGEVRDLGQPSLDRILSMARERAPEVIVAQSELATSRSALVGARLPSVGNPYLEVVAGRGDRGVTRDVELRSNLAVPLEIAGQRSRRIAEAEAWIDLHSVGLEQIRAMVAGATVRAWGMAVGESARFDALEELTGIAVGEYEILEARRKAGDATEQDVQLGAIEVGRHRILLEEARANLTEALGELERITGVNWGKISNTVLRAPTERLAPSAAMPDVGQSPNVRGHRAEEKFHGRTLERYGREGWSPLNVILTGGRGDFGETRVGIGVGMNLPVFRRFQGERARAEGDRNRSAAQAAVTTRVITARLETIRREISERRRAVEALESEAMPAAQAAVTAATELRRMGKSEYLAVLIARREVSNLTLRRIDLAEREWALLSNWVELTGKLP